MTIVRVLATASLGVVLAGQALSGQSLSRYRDYALGSSLASVVKTSGARDADRKTLHETPAKIQEVEWRAPYVGAAGTQPDPVRAILFSFYDDQLYRVVVSYDRDRLDGLTNGDMIESIAATYGALPMHSRPADSPPLEMPADTTVVARWDDGASVLSLVRGGYSREFQLVLISKQLSAQARTALREAVRQEARDAPQRELAQRRRDAADALVSKEKARAVNKAAFRP